MAEHDMRPDDDYAVVWRIGEGPAASGRLELSAEALLLHNARSQGELRIAFGELSSIQIGRGADERVNGERSLILERRSRERVLIAALGGVGLLGELNELLARLRAQHIARSRVAVVLPIRRGKAELARQLIEQGPPFDLEEIGLERHHVFISEHEVVFLFEGEEAAAVVEALAREPGVLKAAARWQGILAAGPRLAEERFSWTRTA